MKNSLRPIAIFHIAVLMTAIMAQISTAQILDTPAEQAQRRITAAANKLPYKISSRIHLQQGSNVGYLVVKVELEKNRHIYSLTQKGEVPPTELKVEKSKLFRLTGTFNADTPAKIIAKDPTFGHRVEKHIGTVQFFAPIEVATGIDLKTLKSVVKFNGQVCADAACIPITNKSISGKFAGYFQRKPKKTATKPGPISRTASSKR